MSGKMNKADLAVLRDCLVVIKQAGDDILEISNTMTKQLVFLRDSLLKVAIAIARINVGQHHQ